MAESLKDSIKNLVNDLGEKLTPDQNNVMQNSIQRSEKSVQPKLRAGDPIPQITLPNAKGEPVSIQELLKNGPVVLTFYRGAWCPVCNLQLHALQGSLDEIKAQQGQLVAISPQTPDKSLSQKEKENLDFEVLSDNDNQIAKAFGLAYQVDEPMQGLYSDLGIDVNGHNGNQSYELPATATFIIRRDGVIEKDFIDPDFTNRVEPKVIIDELKALPKTAAV